MWASDMKYKIIKHMQYDEKAELKSEYYTVAELKDNWMFGESWVQLYATRGYGQAITTFPSVEDAREFIDRLMNGVPRNTTVDTGVEIIG